MSKTQNFESLFGTIDLTNVTTGKDFDVLPEGSYGGKITGVEVKPTKAGNGNVMHVEVTLVGGQGVKGRKLKEFIVITHENDTAVRIGKEKLKKLLQVTDNDSNSFSDTSVFLGELVGVKVTVEDTEKFGEQNRISKFFKFNEDLMYKTV